MVTHDYPKEKVSRVITGTLVRGYMPVEEMKMKVNREQPLRYSSPRDFLVRVAILDIFFPDKLS